MTEPAPVLHATDFMPRLLLKDVAYDRLKQMIVSGELPQGSFLAERRLADILQMSKTPVKSALERLEAEGFLAISPQQGIMVRTPTRDEVLDLIELRVALETLAVDKVSQRGLSAEQAAKLRANLEQQQVALTGQQQAQLAQLDIEFHMLLCEVLGNKQVYQVMSLLKSRLEQMAFFVSSKSSGRAEVAVAEHQAIFDAVAAGQSEQARTLLEQHLEYSKQFLIVR